MARGLPKRSAWLTSLFRRRAADQDLDDEIAAHLQLMIDEKIAHGMTHEQARRAAKIELGGMEAVKEAVKDVRVGAWLDTFLQDVRFGLRMLRKNPGFAAVAVLTLALGIGSNTAVFSMVNGILLRQLPYPQAQQLYVVNENVPQLKSDTPWWPWFPVNAGNFLRWQGHCPAVSSMALIGQTTLNLTGEGIPRQVEALRVSSDFFPLMGIRPQIGRAFFAGEDQQGRDHEVILTAPFWRRVFHSDPDMIGKAITLDNAPYTVVGIMPENFRFPELPRLSNDTPDVFKPFGFRRWDFWPGVGGFNYIALARLKPGARPREAVAQLNVIEARIASKGDARRQVAPGEFDLRATLRPLKTVIVGPAQRALGMLMVAAGLVLLIICVNLASLMLARNLDRTHEVAMRSALGASTLRLTRQFLTEGVVLVVAGVALGLLIAVLGLRFLVANAPVAIPRLREIHLNSHVLLFTAVVAVVCVLFCPLLPALRLSKVQPFEALKSATPAATGAYETARTRSALVVSQIALCAVLLAGALLLIESLHHVSTANQWMDKEHVLSAELVVPPAELRTTEHASQFFSSVLEKVRVVPGVESAGITSKLPLLGPGMSDDISIREAPHPENRPEVGQFRFVSPGYFQTVGLPLAAGRWLLEADKDKNVAVISESVARTLLHGRNPIGMHLLWSQLPPAAPNKIIGVVGDVRTTSDGPAVPTVYLPLWTFYQQPSTLVVRSRIDPAALEKSISGAVWSVDPQVAIPQERTLNTVVSRSEAARRYETSLGTAFAAFALLLAALGLYGVVSYSVRQRTHEIGIRRALGAQPADILRDVLGKGGRMALMGVALGAVAALGLTRLMASMLFGVSATDPLTFAAVVVLLLVVALLACWIPARKAMRVDPMATLRHE